MLGRLMRTDDSAALLVARLALGVVIFPHGAQKLLGWFGGQGFSASLHAFQQYWGIPAFFATLAIVTELFGGIALVLGLLGRLAAFGVAVDMLVAVWLVHFHNGFFMNWSGNKPGEGFEFHILAIGIAVAVMIAGSGALSLDRSLSRRHGPTAPEQHPR